MNNYKTYPNHIKTLLNALEPDQGATARELMAATGTSRATLFRLLASLREDWGCVIEYDRAEKQYRMTDSGLFDPTAIKKTRYRH